MEVFKPFLGYNYFNKFEKSNNFSRFVCPYDFQIYLKDKEDLFTKNEHNVFNFKGKEDGREKFKNWVDGSVLVSSKVPAFYIYEISYKIYGVLYKLLGIVGALKLPEKGEEFIFSCEEGLEKEIEENFNFLKDSGFYSSPVCAMFEGEKDSKILNLIKNKMASSYIFKAKQDNVVHKIWKIEDEDALKILVDFFKEKLYYIVCGVEKFEAAIKYRDFLRERDEFEEEDNYIMAMLFPKEGFSFTALPFHRLVSGDNMFFGEEILKKASKYFNISNCKTLNSMRSTLFNFRRKGEIAFGFYADECYYVLCLKESEIDSLKKNGFSYEKLDVFVLNRLFFKEILNISDDDISYCFVDEVASKTVDCGDACFSIYLSAIRNSEFFEALNLKKKLPKKSYYFFPSPVEGLLFYFVRQKEK